MYINKIYIRSKLNINILISICGLDCEKCEARIATINNDDKLRREVALKWSDLNRVKITKDMINCLGCRMNGVKTPFCDKYCPIRKCALLKKMKTFKDCNKAETCDKLRMVISNN